jgi:hypothetical protein
MNNDALYMSLFGAVPPANSKPGPESVHHAPTSVIPAPVIPTPPIPTPPTPGTTVSGSDAQTKAHLLAMRQNYEQMAGVVMDQSNAINQLIAMLQVKAAEKI